MNITTLAQVMTPAQIEENTRKMISCPGPHRFVFSKGAGLYICATCDCHAPPLCVEWYEQGLGHGEKMQETLPHEKCAGQAPF